MNDFKGRQRIQGELNLERNGYTVGYNNARGYDVRKYGAKNSKMKMFGLPTCPLLLVQVAPGEK